MGAARAHEQPAGAPRERHIAPEQYSLLNRLLILDDGLRDLGVMKTALVQRGACECSDACRCCELPGTALCAASRCSGGGAPAGYTYTPEQSVYLVFLHRLHHRVHQPFLLFYLYTYVYISSIYIYICRYILSVTPALLLVYI